MGTRDTTDPLSIFPARSQTLRIFFECFEGTYSDTSRLLCQVLLFLIFLFQGLRGLQRDHGEVDGIPNVLRFRKYRTCNIRIENKRYRYLSPPIVNHQVLISSRGEPYPTTRATGIKFACQPHRLIVCTYPLTSQRALVYDEISTIMKLDMILGFFMGSKL